MFSQHPTVTTTAADVFLSLFLFPPGGACAWRGVSPNRTISVVLKVARKSSQMMVRRYRGCARVVVCREVRIRGRKMLWMFACACLSGASRSLGSLGVGGKWAPLSPAFDIRAGHVRGQSQASHVVASIAWPHIITDVHTLRS